MARIRNLGELNYHIIVFEEDIAFMNPVHMVIRLDNPIVISEAMIKSIANYRDEKFDLSDFVGETELIVQAGKALRGNFAGMIPNSIVNAFKSQRIYENVHISLDTIDRGHRTNAGYDTEQADVSIFIDLPKKIENKDRFLQSFARKLNSWLAKTKNSY